MPSLSSFADSEIRVAWSMIASKSSPPSQHLRKSCCIHSLGIQRTFWHRLFILTNYECTKGYVCSGNMIWFSDSTLVLQWSERSYFHLSILCALPDKKDWPSLCKLSYQTPSPSRFVWHPELKAGTTNTSWPLRLTTHGLDLETMDLNFDNF